MTRLLLTIVIPLILPSIAYILWLNASGRKWPVAGVIALPWPWLVGAGVVLTAITLFTASLHYGSSPTGTYVPPHVEGGSVVPGHVVPGPKS